MDARAFYSSAATTATNSDRLPALLARLPRPDACDVVRCVGLCVGLLTPSRSPPTKLSRLPPDPGMCRYESRPQKFTVFNDGTLPRWRSDAPIPSRIDPVDPSR